MSSKNVIFNQIHLYEKLYIYHLKALQKLYRRLLNGTYRFLIRKREICGLKLLKLLPNSVFSYIIFKYGLYSYMVFVSLGAFLGLHYCKMIFWTHFGPQNRGFMLLSTQTIVKTAQKWSKSSISIVETQ